MSKFISLGVKIQFEGHECEVCIFPYQRPDLTWACSRVWAARPQVDISCRHWYKQLDIEHLFENLPVGTIVEILNGMKQFEDKFNEVIK